MVWHESQSDQSCPESTLIIPANDQQQLVITALQTTTCCIHVKHIGSSDTNADQRTDSSILMMMEKPLQTDEGKASTEESV